MTSPDRDTREPVDAYLRRIWGTEIKPGREERLLRDDPSLAKEVSDRLSMEPLPDGVVAPITTALPTSLCPVKYVLHVWTYRCTLCNSEHKHSEMFALNHLKPKFGMGSWVRNMTPVSRLEWNVPIDVHNITTRTSAGCFECLDALRSEVLPTLRQPPVPEAPLKLNPTTAEGGGTASTAKGKKLSSTDDFIL